MLVKVEPLDRCWSRMHPWVHKCLHGWMTYSIGLVGLGRLWLVHIQGWWKVIIYLGTWWSAFHWCHCILWCWYYCHDIILPYMPMDKVIKTIAYVHIRENIWSNVEWVEPSNFRYHFLSWHGFKGWHIWNKFVRYEKANIKPYLSIASSICYLPFTDAPKYHIFSSFIGNGICHFFFFLSCITCPM